jgi:hypothetical protein
MMTLEQMILTPQNNWTDPYGNVWHFWKGVGSKWYYKRPEWLISGPGFKTKHEAKLDLLRFFQDVQE